MELFVYTMIALYKEAIKLSFKNDHFFEEWANASTEFGTITFTVEQYARYDFAPDAMGMNVGEGWIVEDWYEVTKVNNIAFMPVCEICHKPSFGDPIDGVGADFQCMSLGGCPF